jgi:hypothetical protein
MLADTRQPYSAGLLALPAKIAEPEPFSARLWHGRVRTAVTCDIVTKLPSRRDAAGAVVSSV